MQLISLEINHKENFMSLNQVKLIEKFLTWLKSCPFKCTISSMQGSFIHVKFWLDELEVPSKKED
jgi:hypothetical protein